MWTSELSVDYGLGQTPKDVDDDDVHVFLCPIWDWVFGLAVRSMNAHITNRLTQW